MRKAAVYRNGELIGTLTEESRSSYIFRYDDRWFVDVKKPAVSLTLPKSQLEYHSQFLFPFFFNLLSEGANRELQCRHWKIDDAPDVRTHLIKACVRTS